MTTDEILEMAVSAGIVPWTKHEHIGGNNFSATEDGLDGDIASLVQFAKLVDAKATAREQEKICRQIAALHDSIMLASHATLTKRDKA